MFVLASGHVELVVRVPGVELPRRRRLHRADPRDGQPERRRAVDVDHLHVDLTPPTAFSLTTPTAGFVGATATVSATAADPGGSGIAQLEFRYCAGRAARSQPARRSAPRSRRRASASQRWDLSRPDGRRAVHGRRACDGRRRQHDRLRADDRDARQDRADDERRRAGRLTLLRRHGHALAERRLRIGRRLDELPRRRRRLARRHERRHPRAGRPLERRLAHDRLRIGRQRRQRRGHHDTRASRSTPQAPSGTPLDPGSVLAGTVALSDPSPSDAGAGVASVAFQYSPHGAGTWTTIGTATSAPWSIVVRHDGGRRRPVRPP